MSYKGKDGQGVHYTMTARVDKKEKLSVVEDNLLQIFSRYLKHRSYVGNVNIVLSMLKEGFSGKYIELDFSEKLPLWPKHKAQSAHFSEKQHTLHCAIFRPGDTIFPLLFLDFSNISNNNKTSHLRYRSWYSFVVFHLKCIPSPKNMFIFFITNFFTGQGTIKLLFVCKLFFKLIYFGKIIQTLGKLLIYS